MLPPRAKNVLIVRSASQYALLQAIAALREDVGVETVGILSQPAWAERCRNLGKVHSWPDQAAFDRSKLAPILVEEITREKYDLGVALYATEAGIGYENVDALLAALPVNHRVAYDAALDEWLDPGDPELSGRRRVLEETRGRGTERLRAAVARIRNETGA